MTTKAIEPAVDAGDDLLITGLIADSATRVRLRALLEETETCNPTGLGQLITESLRNQIFAIASSFTIDSDEAEDITQVALVRINASSAGFRAESAIATWVYRVTANVALAELRRNSRRRRLAARVEREWPRPSDLGLCSGTLPISVRLEATIAACLERIPRKQREVFRRSALRGETTREIAAELNMCPVSVRVSLSKARRALQAELEKSNPRIQGELHA